MLSSNQAKAYAKLCYNTDESQVRRFDLDNFMTYCYNNKFNLLSYSDFIQATFGNRK